MGPLREGKPKRVWNALTVLWSPQAVSMDIWDCNFTPKQQVTLPLHFFNDTDRRSTLVAKVEIVDAFARRSFSKTVECRVEPYAKSVVESRVEMPDRSGDYILRTTLLNPIEKVKYPVVSEWDIRLLEAEVPASVAAAAIYIPSTERELLAMAHRLGLKRVDSPEKADVMVLGRTAWESLAAHRKPIERAIARGTSVVMLDIGERNLGQGYPAEAGQLGPLQGVARVREPKITRYDLFGGLSLTCTEMAEPESHLHPDSVHAELWQRLTPRHTALWNGLRGGLLVPASDFDVQGLNRDAFSAQWSRRGADIARMEQGDYYAYELCGFFAFEATPDNKKVIKQLRDKVTFLVEDAPALAMSLNPKAPVRVTDLGSGYRNSAQGSATELVPLAVAGKNLTRTPVVRIGFGENKGCLLLSGLLTEGRLDATRAPEPTPFPVKYDEAAVQMVINMIDSVL